MVNYQKLYAYLVGQVDDVIQMVGDSLLHGKHGYDELFAVGDKLKTALMATEEMYLEQEDTDARD